MKRSVNIWKGIDKITIVLFLLLITLGWFNIYAAVFNEEHSGLIDLSQRYGKQFIWIVAAMVIAVFIVIIDSRFYLFFSWFIYGMAMLLLILVLIFGKEINGAKSWFEFGGLSLQPSEFAKFGTALALASYLNTKRQELTRLSMIIPASAIIIFPVILTAIQPDMGSSVVFFSLFIVLFREGMSPYIFVSGLLMVILFFLTLLVDNIYLTVALIIIAILLIWFATKKWKLVLIGSAIFIFISATMYVLDYYIFKTLGNELVIFISLIFSGLVFAYYIYKRKAAAVLIIYMFLVGSILFVNSVDYTFNNIIKPHQKDRINILLGFKTDPHGTGYNVTQSIISIGSGGLTGKGYLQGTQTKFKFVPKQSSDFIFCTIGEEWGFLGSSAVIGTYLFLLLRLIFLAERQRSVFSRIYGYGVVSILFIHFFINIGMAIGLVPVIGIPLPFFSYGGSSLWGFTILLFIFLRLDASRTEYLV
ncbi:MAG: rod shape-determining protein RodA [Bacteroidetes bacterium]|nr:MAG: rod shape-determining protein RodA [Bacteroidota bacterium]